MMTANADSPVPSPKKKQKKHVKVLLDDEIYNDESGVQVDLVRRGDNYYYLLETIDDTDAKNELTTHLKDLYKSRMKSFQVISTADSYMKRVTVADVKKRAHSMLAYRQVKPSEYRRSGHYMSTLFQAKDNTSVLVPDSKQCIVCPYCSGAGFKKCHKCDLNIGSACAACRNKLSLKKLVTWDCSDPKCSMKNGSCMPGETHGHCGRCEGKGKIFEYVQLDTERAVFVRDQQYELSKQLAGDQHFPSASTNLYDDYTGVKLVCASNFSMRESDMRLRYGAGAIPASALKYRETVTEIIPVKKITFVWKKKKYISYVGGSRHNIYFRLKHRSLFRRCF